MEAESGVDQEQNGFSSACPVSISQGTDMMVQAREGVSCCHCGIASNAAGCRYSDEIACVRFRSRCDVQ